jgi:hypothetical protein
MSAIEQVNGIKLRARYADLGDLRGVLEDQRARSLDLVGPQQWITALNGCLVVAGAEPVVGDDGVTDPNGIYTVTEVAEEGISEKLGVPRSYLRKLRDGRLDLWDANVNGLLHGRLDVPGSLGYPPYPGKLMLRLLRGDESGTGVARAILSDRYQRIDNLDVLVATLGGVRDAGLLGKVQVHGDLTDRKMYVTIEAPEITALAPVMLAGYRSPWGPGGIDRARRIAGHQGYEPGTEPVLHAGLRISNSETGDGRFTIAPHLTVKICRNGMTISGDALASIHIGGRQEEGIVTWSDRTNQKALELVASKAQDAVTRFLDPAYISAVVARLERDAGAIVTDPVETIKVISRQSGFPQDLANDILGAFTAGGQLNAAGIMNAVTATAQMVSDADLAALLESEAVNVLASAARIG